ncbi:MAG TPA: hypothetical protein VM010_07160 [Chitinophagaceae bacterium]|nr:hypothetical protein [Chitinophagaceae bacterium]
MKQLLTTGLGLILLLLVINSPAQEVAKAANPNAVAQGSVQQAGATMQGAYALNMQMINDGTRDSMINIQQFKLYTDRHFMYAHAEPGDSLAFYGIGTYSMENGRLMEYPFYTSASGARNDTFEIKITKLGNGYVQVINFPPDSQGRKYVLTEEYGNVSAHLSSPLDGAWKQTKSTFIPTTGAPVVTDNPTEFKVFQSGHFIWASTSVDSATGKPASYFGYGTFEMDGRNTAKERTTNSTFRTTLIGKPVRVQLEFMGKDGYRQTIVWPNGKSVETYERLK